MTRLPLPAQLNILLANLKKIGEEFNVAVARPRPSPASYVLPQHAVAAAPLAGLDAGVHVPAPPPGLLF